MADFARRALAAPFSGLCWLDSRDTFSVFTGDLFLLQRFLPVNVLYGYIDFKNVVFRIFKNCPGFVFSTPGLVFAFFASSFLPFACYAS